MGLTLGLALFVQDYEIFAIENFQGFHRFSQPGHDG